MIPSSIEYMTNRLNLSIHEVREMLHDFLHVTDLEKYGNLTGDLHTFVKERCKKEEDRRLVIVKSIVIERLDKTARRAIIFETDWTGASCVHDIAEAPTEARLRKWFRSIHRDVRHVRVGHDCIEVEDAFAAAIAMMRPSE